MFGKVWDSEEIDGVERLYFCCCLERDRGGERDDHVCIERLN